MLRVDFVRMPKKSSIPHGRSLAQILSGFNKSQFRLLGRHFIRSHFFGSLNQPPHDLCSDDNPLFDFDVKYVP